MTNDAVAQGAANIDAGTNDNEADGLQEAARQGAAKRVPAKAHSEHHKIKNIGWLRAAVLGANDGIVSTTSIVLGVAGSHANHEAVLVAGIAGMVAGSMSMATGEYVSVASQEDTEKAALVEEKTELKADYASEKKELALIYVRRGLDRQLADQVADELMKHDALAAHAQDELGLSEISQANPLQAAVASACSFASGAALPLAIVAFVPHSAIVYALAVGALVSLAVLGGLAAKAGGAPIRPGVLRVLLWSALAMGITYAAGAIFGAKG